MTLINKCKQVDSIAATFIYAQQQATLNQQGLRAELGHWKGPNFKPKQAVTKATNRTACAKDKQASTPNGRPSPGLRQAHYDSLTQQRQAVVNGNQRAGVRLGQKAQHGHLQPKQPAQCRLQWCNLHNSACPRDFTALA